jgi:ribonuclease HII
MVDIAYPGCEIEDSISDDGKVVCGMDEVGRGAWAGPLVLSCVIPSTGTIPGVRDSKKVAPKKREVLFDEIISWAKGVGIGVVTNVEIDEWGMSKALTVCASRALDELQKTSVDVDVVLLDGHYDFIRQSQYEVRTIIKGDNVSHAIAAASIVAKVYRDRYMASDDVAGRYQDFSFEKNKGYPAPVHKQALATNGPTPLHRISWDILGAHAGESTTNALF